MAGAFQRHDFRRGNSIGDGLADGDGFVERPRGEADFGSLAGQEAGRALADGAGAGEDDGGCTAEVDVFGGGEDGGGGGGVGSVGVEQHRDAHRAEEGFFCRGEQFFAGGDVGAADENGGLREVLRGAGEDRAVDEVADSLGFTLAYCSRRSTPESVATTASKTLGWGSESSWMRILGRDILEC